MDTPPRPEATAEIALTCDPRTDTVRIHFNAWSPRTECVKRVVVPVHNDRVFDVWNQPAEEWECTKHVAVSDDIVLEFDAVGCLIGLEMQGYLLHPDLTITLVELIQHELGREGVD